MCGLFGAISPNWNPGVIRSLAICNRERGTDSLGFFDSSGRMIKGAKDPMQVLGQENITNWIQNSNQGTDTAEPSWFIAGHTRQRTRGAATRKNAHPFRYGKIVGSHNGMVDAPSSYNVDSMVLFDELNKNHGDYQAALEDISGYWGLTWYDGEGFYMQVHTGSLHIVQVDGVWYYSSDDDHLTASVGHADSIYELKEGETWKFTFDGETIVTEQLETFVSRASYTTKKYAQKYTTEYYDDVDQWEATTPTVSESVHDWDAGWRDAWDEYCTASEHAVGV